MSDWFVEVNAAGNEMVAEFLARHNISEAESILYDQLCADGKKRDVWRIRGSYVERFKHALAQFPHMKLSFFTRSSPGAVLSKANFVKKKKSSAKVLAAARSVARAKEKKDMKHIDH